jgi:hypothetical protein
VPQLGGKRTLYGVSRSTITCGSTMSVAAVRLKLTTVAIEELQLRTP